MRKRWIVHRASVIRFLIYCKKLLALIALAIDWFKVFRIEGAIR